MEEIQRETKQEPQIEAKKEIVSKSKLLESGIYFGTRKSQWNPKMKPYILATKRGTHIIDIQKTKMTLEFAYQIIYKLAQKGASFIFVGTKKQAKKTIKENALRTNSLYVSERWLGGTLTNSRTIFQRVKRLEYLEKLAENNFEGYTKKEGVMFQKELSKLNYNLSGIRKMKYKPNVMIVADPIGDAIAIREAKKLGVKIIGIADTNVDPNTLDIFIPANDDSIKSITLVITILADAISAAKNGPQLFAFQGDDKVVLPQENKARFKQKRVFANRRSGFKPPEKRSSSNFAKETDGSSNWKNPTGEETTASKNSNVSAKTRELEENNQGQKTTGEPPVISSEPKQKDVLAIKKGADTEQQAKKEPAKSSQKTEPLKAVEKEVPKPTDETPKPVANETKK